MLLLSKTNIGANATTVGLTAKGLHNLQYLAVEAEFVVDSGGGTADVYVQTSLDGGATWIDIMNFHFTTASKKAVSAVVMTTALAASVDVTSADGALASGTILSGLLGPMIRAKLVTASTVYGGATTLKVYAVPVLASAQTASGPIA